MVGVAITATTAVPGCTTGSTCFASVDGAARFSIEVAKRFSDNKCSFYDEKEYEALREKYGPMTILQTGGK